MIMNSSSDLLCNFIKVNSHYSMPVNLLVHTSLTVGSYYKQVHLLLSVSANTFVNKTHPNIDANLYV